MYLSFYKREPDILNIFIVHHPRILFRDLFKFIQPGNIILNILFKGYSLQSIPLCYAHHLFGHLNFALG